MIEKCDLTSKFARRSPWPWLLICSRSSMALSSPILQAQKRRLGDSSSTRDLYNGCSSSGRATASFSYTILTTKQHLVSKRYCTLSLKGTCSNKIKLTYISKWKHTVHISVQMYSHPIKEYIKVEPNKICFKPGLNFQ